MEDQFDYSSLTEKFDLPCQAIRDTEWVTNPADLATTTRGVVRRGETIWLHRDNLGNGSWQQVRLADDTLRYVQHHDFAHQQSNTE